MKISKENPAQAAVAQSGSLRGTFCTYYLLTKPGIVRGNLFTATAGYFLAASGAINLWHLAAMLVGLAFVIASGCVCNNYLDRLLDARMARTSKRALVTGAIATEHALVFAAILGVMGTAILAIGCNLLTAALAVFGFFAYVVVYGIAKRTTVHGTVIGSISGAIPPIVGYAAAGNGLDLAAFMLFAALVCWQMPHFYAIALYRFEDYKAAGLPVLSVKKGFAAARTQIILYAIAYTLVVSSFAMLGITSAWVGLALTLIAVGWLLQTLTGLHKMTDDATAHWARQLFGTSLLVLTTFSVALVIDSFIA